MTTMTERPMTAWPAVEEVARSFGYGRDGGSPLSLEFFEDVARAPGGIESMARACGVDADAAFRQHAEFISGMRQLLAPARREYGVWCSVYGGVTGHREDWLKNDDGAPARFPSLETAQAACPTSYTSPRGVTFTYTIHEF